MQPDAPSEDATRRTYLAQERTLLAWWRSSLACFAVAIGIGRLVPSLLDVSAAPFVVLGGGYGALGLVFLVVSAVRNRAVNRSLGSGQFEPLQGGLVVALGTAMLILGTATMVLLVVGT